MARICSVFKASELGAVGDEDALGRIRVEKHCRHAGMKVVAIGDDAEEWRAGRARRCCDKAC